MAQLTIQDGKYLVDGQELTVGMTISRYDGAARDWFTGEVEEIRIYSYEQEKYVSILALVVEGFAPSPLADGQEIEMVSEGN